MVGYGDGGRWMDCDDCHTRAFLDLIQPRLESCRRPRVGTEEVGEMAMTPMCDCWLVADSCVISARHDSRTKRLAVGSTNWHGLKCNDADGCSTERTRDMASSCDEVVRISTAAL